MFWPLLLFIVGLALSAMFSGSETGFYRVARLRLEIAAEAGDWIARCLAWLAARPGVFIATALVGNNLANYLVSFSVVLLAQEIAQQRTGYLELFATTLAAPVVFLLGELLPKRLFLQAPFSLLRCSAPLFLVFVVLLSPISVILWLGNWLLTLLVPADAQRARSEVAGRTLHYILQEGEHANLIVEIQRHIAQTILQHGGDPVIGWAKPLADLPLLPLDASFAELQRRVPGHVFCLVSHPQQPQQIVGYVEVARWILAPHRPLREIMRPLLRVLESERLLTAMELLYHHREHLLAVVNASGQVIAIVREADLRQTLLQTNEPASGSTSLLHAETH